MTSAVPVHGPSRSTYFLLVKAVQRFRGRIVVGFLRPAERTALISLSRSAYRIDVYWTGSRDRRNSAGK